MRHTLSNDCFLNLAVEDEDMGCTDSVLAAAAVVAPVTVLATLEPKGICAGAIIVEARRVCSAIERLPAARLAAAFFPTELKGILMILEAVTHGNARVREECGLMYKT